MLFLQKFSLMDIYLIIVVILFIVAALDLIVGVSNDAVNFLNSALGSKVASFKTIMIIASVGIFIGAFSSSGMMEIARKGVFNPELFTYEGVMFLFLAVMLTDIILLDFFNEIGMPTSTTVSIVFELLGAATMIAFLLVAAKQGGSEDVSEFMNRTNALRIIAGIFTSVLIAFTLGMLVQFLSRWALTFNYQHKLDGLAPVFAGIAITSITYFLFVKGIKSSSWGAMDISKFSLFSWVDRDSVLALIKETAKLDAIRGGKSAEEIEKAIEAVKKVKLMHVMQYYTLPILVVLFVFWTIVNFILSKVAKVNPLKVVVLAGTFALAMAFAGNDLVNFIGVPIGAFQAREILEQTAGAVPSEFLMTPLNDAVKVPKLFLAISGIIMIITLWTSSKAKKVTETEINLARQDAGVERFKPNLLAKGIVQVGETIGKALESITPMVMRDSIKNSYVASVLSVNEENKPAFDLVRASVNLMMASIIISIATFKKLPLSTTYVSFMVAMGTSLADKAWGKESAVYRVSGVLNVIGGWLLTALIAFVASAIFALVLFKLKMVGIVIVCLIAGYALFRTNFSNRTKKKNR